MQLIIKGLKGEQESIEVPEESSILDVKAIIMSQLGHAVTCQKLLYKGKILEDNKFLTEYGIQNGNTIVIMVTKIQEPSLYEKNLQELINLGVPRQDAETLLKMTENDLEKAKKIILQSVQGDDEEEEDEEDEEDNENLLAGQSGNFGFLLNSEEFLKIRDILRRNPNEFQPMMSQMAVSNPELYELIRNHTEEFLNLVGLRMAPRENIEITQQEEADIRELCQLGFSEEDAIEAYIACDKNKELAASYLFENYQQQFN